MQNRANVSRQLNPSTSGALIAAGMAILVALAPARGAEPGPRVKVLGLDNVIAFVYTPTAQFDPKGLHSVTLIGPRDARDWKYWQDRGVVMGTGHIWKDLLRSPVKQAVENLVSQDAGGNPRPVVMIDEFGFDYGGEMDQKSADILRQAKRQKPELALTVFQMRGPIAPVLADAYREAVDLVMMESYVGDKRSYWWIACQAWAARYYHLLPKAIVVLGVGKGGNPGENWALTAEELEQQIRFVRLIAPESPGIGFYSGTPELLASADTFCAHFSDIPTDGKGLPPDLLELARTFNRRYDKATLVVSPALVQPNYSGIGIGILAEPKTFRPFVINLGDQDAHDVRVRLRNPPDKGGDVFAEGVVPIVPKRGVAVGELRVTAEWHEWVGEWIMEVEAPDCDVQMFGAAR
jgi:hypothetical protein